MSNNFDSHRFWTTERDDFVRAAWAIGQSGDVIAQQLSTLTGAPVTRNKVLGRIHRKGWLSPHSGHKDTRKRAREIIAAAVAVSAVPPEKKRIGRPPGPSRVNAPVKRSALTGYASGSQPETESVPLPQAEDGRNAARRKPLIELAAHECRWPYGEGPFVHCAERVIDGKPYCGFHLIAHAHGTAAARVVFAQRAAQQRGSHGKASGKSERRQDTAQAQD